jgi:tRNA pseudouridine38-40 synthase
MRIALGIEYNGHDFHGWQAQHGIETIQGHLEVALTKIANEPIHLFCAGRTDAHVHATGQVIHFDTRAKRHIDAWIWGTNSHLPSSIVVRWAKPVNHHFHARFTALSRRYRYVIYNHPIRPALLHGRASWYYYPLDMQRIKAAANYLIGEHNFSSFRSSQCASKTPMRRVIDYQCYRHGDYLIFEIEANAFLHHMVRNIVGVLLKIGSGVKTPEWMIEVIQAQSRQAAAETAVPDGLYLIRVSYPEEYSFPLSDKLFLM